MSKYKDAGVDIDKADSFIEKIKPIVSKTFSKDVLTGIGGFGALFSISNEYEHPVLISSTDGVGTKLEIAKLCNNHKTIGLDLVAMCVNDIIVAGAKPLFFLDYFSTGKLNVDVAVDVVKGIADGCKESSCSLIGGETAEMPGLYLQDDYDLAGFTVGIADRNSIIDGSNIKVGDKLIGIPSSGIHSNGYSLVRKICFEELNLVVGDYITELKCTLGEELIKPTKIYVNTILKLTKKFSINGIVHVTGGGLTDNVPRVLPKGCSVTVYKDSWFKQPIFEFLKEKGRVSEEDMLRTFNCGIGMIIIVPNEEVLVIRKHLANNNESNFVIGEVTATDGLSQVTYS